MQMEWLSSEMGFGLLAISFLRATQFTSIVCVIINILIFFMIHAAKFLQDDDPKTDDEFRLFFLLVASLSAALSSLVLLIPILYLTIPTSIVIISIITYGSAVFMNMNININIRTHRTQLASSVMTRLRNSGTFQSFILTFVIVLNLLPIVATLPSIPSTATGYDVLTLLLGGYAESITSSKVVVTFLAIHSFLTFISAAAKKIGRA